MYRDSAGSSFFGPHLNETPPFWLPPFLSSAIRDQLVDIVLGKVGRQKGRDRETDATLGKCNEKLREVPRNVGHMYTCWHGALAQVEAGNAVFA